MICFPALEMKACALALQSDQLCLLALLPPVRLIFSGTLLNDAHTARHCGANNGTSLCAQMADPASSVSWSHNNTDKISKSTLIPYHFFSANWTKPKITWGLAMQWKLHKQTSCLICSGASISPQRKPQQWKHRNLQVSPHMSYLSHLSIC